MEEAIPQVGLSGEGGLCAPQRLCQLSVCLVTCLHPFSGQWSSLEPVALPGTVWALSVYLGNGTSSP